MADAPLMVGVSGLRGIVGKSLTPGIVGQFAGAFGGWLAERWPKGRRAPGWHDQAPLVILGRDGRAGGEVFAEAAKGGLRRAGCVVEDLDIVMTPTVAVMADRMGAAGGVVITASHNPQEWNGAKLLVRALRPAREVDACAPSAAVANEIIARFRTARPAFVHPSLGPSNAPMPRRTHAHIVHGMIVEDGPEQRFKVALDHVNASGFMGAGWLLEVLLGCEMLERRADRTGIFPHPPEPLRENLADLSSLVKEGGAHVGFAQDPDGDRLAIVDERAEYIGEEYTFVLAAECLLPNSYTEAASGKGGQPVLVTNLSTSRMIDDVAARHGARVIRTPVGEANVVEAMKRERDAGRNVVLGGEGNGGVIWPKVTYVRDSLSSMALVLALMARTGKKVSELVADLPRYAIEKRKVDLARKEDAAPAVEKIARAYSSGPSAGRIDRQDGVRVDWGGDGPLPGGGGGAGKAWVHVRASNTEPIMRLIAEAPTADQAKRILDEVARVAGV